MKKKCEFGILKKKMDSSGEEDFALLLLAKEEAATCVQQKFRPVLTRYTVNENVSFQLFASLKNAHRIPE